MVFNDPRYAWKQCRIRHTKLQCYGYANFMHPSQQYLHAYLNQQNYDLGVNLVFNENMLLVKTYLFCIFIEVKIQTKFISKEIGFHCNFICTEPLASGGHGPRPLPFTLGNQILTNSVSNTDEIHKQRNRLPL